MRFHSELTIWGMAVMLCPSLQNLSVHQNFIEQLAEKNGSVIVLESIQAIHKQKGSMITAMTVNGFQSYLEAIIFNKQQEIKASIEYEQKINSHNFGVFL